VAISEKGAGWKRLQRETAAGLLGRATSTHVQGPRDGAYNTVAELRVVGLVDPEEDVAYDYEASITASQPKVATCFVTDILGDTVRLMEIEAGRRTREDYMAGGGAYSQLAARAGLPAGPGNTEPGEVNGDVAHLSAEERMLLEEEQGEVKDLVFLQEQKLLTAARNGNLDGCVEALSEDAFIEAQDEFGNTPLVLAAQQGAKKLLKELMRRGAMLNHQNHAGCTCLHYCYAYKHGDVGDNLKDHGADDSLLNAEGLTCYEGLHSGEVDDI
jgi:hypothetical protein